MLRAFVCAAVAVMVCVNVSSAADKKAGGEVHGVVKSVDAAKGTITVTVKVKKETQDKEFTVTDATKFVLGDQQMTGKDGLKSDHLKAGTQVAIHADPDGKATEIKVGGKKKAK
jgi:hypothetical protein